MDYSKLSDKNGSYIAYRKLQGKKASIVFFGGFASNMNGTKANAIYKFCQENDVALVLFDYFGHGQSSGNFTDYTISDWHKNCIRVINELTHGEQIVIGSSGRMAYATCRSAATRKGSSTDWYIICS